MRVKLISLRLAPPDEIAEILDMLETNNIDHYFIPEGSFGVSAATIWLPDNKQIVFAKKMLAEYQAQRAIASQNKYKEQKLLGQQNTWLGNFMHQPVVSILYILVSMFFVYLMFVPLVHL